MKTSKVESLWKALKVAIPLLLILIAMAPMLSVNAQDNIQFGVRPTNQNTANTSKGYFTLTATPGASIQESITLSNPGTVPVKLLVFPVDAITSQRSGPGYLGIEDQRKEVGTWIQFDTNEVILDPQKQVNVKLTVAVPSGVKDGQHLGGIVVQAVPVAQTAAGAKTGSSFGATTVTRNVIAVMVTVGNEKFTPSIKIEGVGIKDVEGAPTLTISLNNDGPILAKPKGDFTVTDASGKVVLNNKLSLESLVPQTSIDYPIFTELTKTPGTYKVKTSLDYGGIAPAIYEGSLVITSNVVKTPVAPVTASSNDPWFSGNDPVNATVAPQPALAPGVDKSSNQAIPASTNTSDSQNLLPIIGGIFLLVVVVGGGGYLFGKKGKGR